MFLTVQGQKNTFLLDVFEILLGLKSRGYGCVYADLRTGADRHVPVMPNAIRGRDLPKPHGRIQDSRGDRPAPQFQWRSRACFQNWRRGYRESCRTRFRALSLIHASNEPQERYIAGLVQTSMAQARRRFTQRRERVCTYQEVLSGDGVVVKISQNAIQR